MTVGEKMVWAVVYTATLERYRAQGIAIADGLRIAAAEAAASEVCQLRGILQPVSDGFGRGVVTRLLREMLK